MNTSSFMDKQIMDLSSSAGGKEFVDLNNNDKKKEEILAGYDFQPIRSHNLDGSEGSRKTVSAFKTYGSTDALEPAKVLSEKERIPDAAILSEIERTMKNHADELLHALEGVSARLTQLESKTRHLEHSVDDLKVAVGNNYGSTDGKMRQLENILREVQTGVQVLTDKHDAVVAHLESVKLQAPKVVDQAAAPVQQSATALQRSYQQLPLPPAAPTLPSPNAPPPPPPPPQLQNFSPQVQFANQFSQSQIPPAAEQDPYLPPPSQSKDSPNPQYQLPQTQPPQAPPSSVPHQQYPPAPLPYQQYMQGPQPSQQHPSLPTVNPPPQHQPPTDHHPEETPYTPSQSYPPNTYQPPSYPPNSSAPPSQQFYGSPSHMYELPSGRPGSGYSNEPPSSRPGSGYSSGYGGPAGPSEPFPYSGSPRYGGGATMKPQHFSSSGTSQGGGSGYPQLPTARILPQALPTATPVSGGSGSSGTGNRVPVDDVVDKVTNMGFPRDQVRATVRRLTENGQSVDLNVVLDKLMNGR